MSDSVETINSPVRHFNVNQSSVFFFYQLLIGMFVLHSLAPCNELSPPAHGRRMGEDFRHGRSASFLCSYGYARIGVSTIRCNDGN